MKAIVYMSQTGFTQRYARMLSEKTGVPAWSLAEAKKQLRQGDDVFYMGWLMAGSVKGLDSAMDRYVIRGVWSGLVAEKVRFSVFSTAAILALSEYMDGHHPARRVLDAAVP